jgi:flagellar assembly protein FliH
MSSTLPKELQTAFQRWEMPSFGDVRPKQLEKIAEQEQITLADISAIKEQAKNEAYADAYKEAYAVGYQEGQQAGQIEMQEQTMLVTSQLSDLKKAYEEQLLNAQDTIGNDLIKLALELASAMTKYRFEQFPEAVSEIVKEAIAALPSIQQPAQIFLNPEDLLMVKNVMGDSLERDAWRLLPDHHMTRGGCRIETAQNLLDASFETRWSRLNQALFDSHPDC